MMTTLKRCMLASLIAGILVAPSLAQSGNSGNGDTDRIQQQDQLQDCTLVPGSLTDLEIEHVLFMRQEEKLARDVYVTFEGWWDADVFARIAVSEQRHMDAVKQIITAAELDDPITDDTVGAFGDEGFADLFDELIGMGQTSYVDSLAVGAYIEELDILDLAACMADLENECVISVFENLMRGSRNHLRAFTTYLAAEGVTYSPVLMTQEDYDAIVSTPMEPGPGQENSSRRR